MPLDDNLASRYLDYLTYEYRLQEAGDDLLEFARMTMADRRKLNDPIASMFMVEPHHRLIAQVLHRFDTEPGYNFCLSVPPRSGKSELSVRRYPSWRLGRHPTDDIALFAFNQDKAEDYGEEMNAVTSHPRFSQVFPDFRWRLNGQAKKVTEEGGNLYLVGRGGTINGRGFHKGLVDDPIKGADEARRPLIRDQLWEWFKADVWSRRHHDGCNVGIIMTRWHADDLVGRISDESNPYYVKEFADLFDIINIPALAVDEHDRLGREIGEPLWPARFSKRDLEVTRATDPMRFACLYQGNPVPDEGVLIKEEDIVEYDQVEYQDVLETLRIYATGDLSSGVDVKNDPSCIAPCGVAPNGDIYVLPDVFWGKRRSEDLVDEIFRMFRDRKPIEFFPEDGTIWKTMAPFIEKRMEEEGVYVPITPVWPFGRKAGVAVGGGDAKVQRFQSAHARMRMGKLKFPGFAPWWSDARRQLLQFPNAANDDFVDAVALIGLQLDHFAQSRPKAQKPRIERDTLAWLEMEDDRRPRRSNGWMRGR